jgi:hypothetical protein
MTDNCHTCGAPIAGYDSVHFGSIETGYRDLCSRCFNEEVADLGNSIFSTSILSPSRWWMLLGSRIDCAFSAAAPR